MPRESVSALWGSIRSCWVDRFSDEDDFDSVCDAVLVVWHWVINDWWNYN